MPTKDSLGIPDDSDEKDDGDQRRKGICLRAKFGF